MRSIKFPNMFNTNSTNVWKSSEYKNATAQNTKLVLLSERRSLIGDPFWGGLIESLTFEQNSQMTIELLADIIYEQVSIFIPQLKIRREDINITRGSGKIYVDIHGINQIDYENDTYSLILSDNSLND